MWIFFFLILFGALLQNIIENLTDFFEYTVITSIESVNQFPMTLPAITFCIAPQSVMITNFTIDENTFSCNISDSNVCDYRELYSYELYVSTANKILGCFVLNGGRNSSGHQQKIRSTRYIGSYAVSLNFYFAEKYLLYYHIHEADIKPTGLEIDRILDPRMIHFLKLEKTSEIKLGLPYKNCFKKSNDLPDSLYVRKVIESNVTYRQRNCVEACLESIYSSQKNKIDTDYWLEMDNCHQFCPLECDSTVYKITQYKFDISYESITNSTKSLAIYIGYDNLKYTKITHTPKTQLSGLISNLGGSAGLFLSFTFLSVCTAIEFILGVIFKF